MERRGSHSHTGPYARKTDRKSIFSKMKDSFKDIMYPSWLSGSGKNEDSGQQKTQPVELTQTPTSTIAPIAGPGNTNSPPFHSQGLEMPNGQPRTQEFAVPGTSNTDSSFQSANLPPPISEFTSSLLPLNRLTEKSDSVLANEDTMSQRSDTSKSTSGCSSMVPQQESGRRDSGPGVEKRKAVDQENYGTQPSSRSPDQQPTVKRQRLNMSLSSGNKTWTQRFNDTFQNQQPASNLKRPAFNASLFGSPFSEDNSVLGTSFHESSFYPGKTVYGGRSSFRSTQKRKLDLNQSLPSRLSFPVKAFKAKPRTNPVKEAVTSSTAKRILDVLDRMPTPLSDAKKIPVILSHNWTQNPSFFSKDVASTSVGPPTRRQTIGGLASISTNRQTSAGPRQQENKAIIEDSSASTSTAVGLQKGDTVRLASDQQPSTSSGKIRREKSYHRGSSSVKPPVVEEDTVVVAPELRTDFTLPVSQIPQFSFNTPSIPKSSSQKSTTVNHKTALNFTFSSPIVERIPTSKPASPQNIGGFQFSSPISLEKKDEAHSTVSSTRNQVSSFSKSTSSTGSMQMGFSTAPKPKPSLNGPTFDAPSGGLKPATELKKGSVMDILGGGSSKQTDTVTSSKHKATVPLSSLFKKVGWTCDICLISNKEEAKKCIACQAQKPAPKQQNGESETQLPKADSSNKATSNTPLSALFKQTGWSCDVCLIQNKEEVDKCIACLAPRPGLKKLTGSTDIAQKNVETANKGTVPSCVKSFTMSQPSGFSFSSAPTSDSSKDTGGAKLLSTGGFKFGTTTSSSNSDFKFGASVNSETTSNASESTFKFGSDSSKTVSGSGFKFGTVKPNEIESNKSVNDISSGGFKFGSVNSSEDKKSQKSADTVEDKGKDQKNIWTPGAGGFQFGTKSLSDSSNTPGGGFKFGSNTGVDSSTIKPTGDLQLGVKTNSSSAVGFQFGTPSSSSLVTSSSAPVTSTSTLSNSTMFSSQAVVSSSDPLKTNSLAPSDFKLTTGSFSSVAPVNKTLSEPSSKDETGLTVTSNSSKDTNSIAVSTSSFTGFVFGAPKVSEAKSEAQKSVFGGFAASTASTPAFGGFNFAQKKDEVQSTGSMITGKPDSMPTKRGRDDVSGENAAKKGNFVFGSNTSSSTPFQFGTANSGGQMKSSPFGVGQTNSSTTQAAGFLFSTNKASDTSKPLFAAPVPSTQTMAAPVFGNTNSVFSFTAQKSEPENKPSTTNASVFNNFGNSTAQSVTPSTGPALNFGGTTMNSTTFGSSAGNNFGGNAPSVIPTFGSTPSVFGTKDSAPVTTAAPVFGGTGVFQFGSDKTAGSNQPAQTNSVFAFGAKPAENTQPPANNTGFNFNSSQAGLGGTANFNFSQSAAPGAFAFSAAPAPSTGERKIKRAVRKLKR